MSADEDDDRKVRRKADESYYIYKLRSQAASRRAVKSLISVLRIEEKKSQSMRAFRTLSSHLATLSSISSHFITSGHIAKQSFGSCRKSSLHLATSSQSLLAFVGVFLIDRA